MYYKGKWGEVLKFGSAKVIMKLETRQCSVLPVLDALSVELAEVLPKGKECSVKTLELPWLGVALSEAGSNFRTILQPRA
jgi:hypothetical protein